MTTTLITGGSSGIGYEMSTYFAKAGHRILWVSLFEEELTEAKQTLLSLYPKIDIHTLALDLSQVDAANAVMEWVKSQGWTVDVLINNAGFGTYGYLHEIELEREFAMIRLNILTVYQMTRLFLAEMMARDAGTIINISSNTSFQPVPRMSTYASTKAFVAHFSRSISEELRMKKSKVQLMTVCPSAIRDTKFQSAANMDKVKTFSGLAFTTPEEVAKDVWNGFQRKKDFVVSGAKMRILYLFRNLVPYRLNQFLVRKELQEE